MLIRNLGTNFSGMLSDIHTFTFKKMHMKCRQRNGGNFVSTLVCFKRTKRLFVGHDIAVSNAYWSVTMNDRQNGIMHESALVGHDQASLTITRWFNTLRPGLLTHICVRVDWVIIGYDNGLLPNKHQAIVWNTDLLSIGLYGTQTSVKF